MIVQAIAIAAWSAGSASPQALPCRQAESHPAYSHNDYQNDRPLLDALEFGFRGVEVDLYLHRGALVTAHDRSQVGRGHRFEEVYLRTLQVAVARCGRVLPGTGSFLLNVELKEHSGAAFDSLLATPGRYPELFRSEGSLEGGPVEVVLVGWYPGPDLLSEVLPAYVRLQARVTDRAGFPDPDPTGLVRLVSLDYGKTIGWSGRGHPPAATEGWLAALQRARSAGAHRIARIYNVPLDSAVYRLLLDEGADLIGVEDLERGHRVLAGMRN